MTPAKITVRPARPSDVSAIVAMVHELAAHEGAPQECHLTEAQLTAALFRDDPALFGHVAADADTDEAVGFALWLLNFSTWEGEHGIYLEDLYVRPAGRGLGAGRALLASLAELAVARGYRRIDWSVLNTEDLAPARAFYRRIGGVALTEWIPWRLTDAALADLGQHTRPEVS